MQVQPRVHTVSPRRRRAFTMVELLVVMGIIAVLASAILVAANSVLKSQRQRNTLTVLQVVSDAVEEFSREQQTRATISKAPGYKRRFSQYPPDELEWFTDMETSLRKGPLAVSYAPGRAIVEPRLSGGYRPMRFFTDASKDDRFEFRDQVAMIVAIETLGDASAAMLDRLDKRYRKTVLDPQADEPAVFLDRPDDSGNLNNSWDINDKQIDYIIDAWGTPISYLAQRDFRESGDTESSNHPSWNSASTEIIKLNGGQPLVFSYGPDGPDQLTAEVMLTDGVASLTGDFENSSPPPAEKGKVTHVTNEDNVYLDPELKTRLSGN